MPVTLDAGTAGALKTMLRYDANTEAEARLQIRQWLDAIGQEEERRRQHMAAAKEYDRLVALGKPVPQKIIDIVNWPVLKHPKPPGTEILVTVDTEEEVFVIGDYAYTDSGRQFNNKGTEEIPAWTEEHTTQYRQ